MPSRKPQQRLPGHRDASLTAATQPGRLGLEAWTVRVPVAVQEDEQGRSCEVLDLRCFPNPVVWRLLHAMLVSVPALLHGSPADKPFQTLRPRPAQDGKKGSGNYTAVYATRIPAIALTSAVMDRAGAAELLGGYRHRWWTAHDGRLVHSVTPKLYAALRDRPEDLTSDGYVYLVPQDAFRYEQLEWYSLEAVTPLLRFQVPRRLARDLFVIGAGPEKDTVTCRGRSVARRNHGASG